jgi:hypothetical protein
MVRSIRIVQSVGQELVWMEFLIRTQSRDECKKILEEFIKESHDEYMKQTRFLKRPLRAVIPDITGEIYFCDEGLYLDMALPQPPDLGRIKKMIGMPESATPKWKEKMCNSIAGYLKGKGAVFDEVIFVDTVK